MKLKVQLLAFILNFINSDYANSQNPLIKQWDYRYGGTRNELLFSLNQSSDGGFILGGYSDSDISGDKAQTNCIAWYNPDYWIVKLNSQGMLQWEKQYGGNGEDFLRAMQPTSDGGYILGGYSNSDSSCEKSQNKWDTISYSSDFWIIKIDSLGNKQWDKDYGGLDSDVFASLSETDDGGYILGGYIASGANGDITQPVWGSYDYWIVKTDALGNKLWDKRFGGLETDKLNCVKQTPDGGYILSGLSYSGISGDKTQASQSPGQSDYWIVKTDAFGNKLWDKTFGGNSDDQLLACELTNDGGYILGGESYSGISGDKTQASKGGLDFWVVKIDLSGNKIWDKTYGGSSFDELFTIVKTDDNGFIFSGDSYSPISGDKTQNNLGFEQGWIVKTDSLGNLQWDKTMLTTGHDENGNTIKTNDGCYVFANFCNGDVGGYKSQPNWDTANVSYDYWLIKFCDTTQTTALNQIVNSNLQYSVSPNPFTTNLSILFSEKNLKQVKLKITNTFGQPVFEKEENNLNNYSTMQLDLHWMTSGVYFLSVEHSEKKAVKKIIKL